MCVCICKFPAKQQFRLLTGCFFFLQPEGVRQEYTYNSFVCLRGTLATLLGFKLFGLRFFLIILQFKQSKGSLSPLDPSRMFFLSNFKIYRPNSSVLTFQMKPLQQYFHMVLFIWYIVLTIESVDKIPSCYHSNETSLAVFSHGTIYLVCCCNF